MLRAMKLSEGFRRPAAGIAALALMALALLTVRFSPDWVAFARGMRDAKTSVTSPAQGVAIDKAIYSAFSARGFYVLQQTRDLRSEIDDPNHKIVRWRLLMPAVGHVLDLPGWVVLGLAHVGCGVLVLVLVAIGFRQARAAGGPAYEALCLGVVAGASAPFFTSMGLLGYYDAWLAVALLAVAFAGPRWVVALACLLAPWIDERFVLGLPLALCVRRIANADTTEPRWQWLKRQALLPLVLVGGYAVVRLKLGGSGGSQTVGQYLQQFVFAEAISPAQRVFGAWEGLHLGWLLVAAAIVGSHRLAARDRRLESGLLAAGVGLTGLVGLFTALDLSRSMVLLLPVVPLGWLFVTRAAWWRRFHLAAILAGLALLLPARHVVGRSSRPVDNLWSPASPLVVAHNNLAALLASLPGRQADALAHYAEALRLKPDYAEARNNLALLLAALPGRQAEALAQYAETLRVRPDYPEAHYNLALLLAALPGRQAEAPAHYAEAIRLKPDFAQAHNNLALLLSGVPGRQQEALSHFAAALQSRPDFAEAHYNLANLLSVLPGRQADALAHYAETVRLRPDFAEAYNNRALLLANLPGRQPEALAHYAEALRLRPAFAEAHNNLAILLGNLPNRQGEAVAHFAEAARLQPNNPAFHYNLARQLEAFADKRAEVRALYRRAVELDPNYAAARAALERLGK